jgi:3-phosphoshikimate 1-carboxyvinyltransferase
MRPLTAALSVLGGDFEMTGVPRMYERPIGDLVDALRQLGCKIDYLKDEGFPPLKIGQPDFSQLGSESIKVRGDVSSQFLTSLLMALPLLANGGTRDITIEVVGELISKPYIHITLELLARFGIAVKNDNWQRFVIPQAAATSRRAPSMWRPMPRRPATSSRWARLPPAPMTPMPTTRRSPRASAFWAWARTRSRAISASSRPPRPWAHRSKAAPTGCRSAVAAGL